MFNKIFVIPKVGGANIELSHALILLIREAVDGLSCAHDIIVTDDISMVDMNTIAVPCGGDGTVLYAAKMLAKLPFDVPILGFNLGHLGFLTDFAPSIIQIVTFVNMVASKNYTTFVEDYRTLLSVEDELGNEYLALNDFVISNLYSDNIIKYDLTIGNSHAGNHKANGVIIATPTGSTAYAMNVGGAIIEPDLDVIEIIPIAGMGMTNRPILVSGKNEITIEIEAQLDRTVSFKADGQECSRYNNENVKLKIVRREKKVRLLHIKGWNFFELLTHKLGWNTK